METLAQYQGLAVLAVSLLLGVFGIVFRAQVLALVADKASAAAVTDLAARHSAHDARLITMEAAIRHLPTAEQMVALTLAVSQLRGDVQTVGERVRAVEKAQDAAAMKLADIDSYLRTKNG